MLRVAVDANSLAWGWSGIPKHVDRIARELVDDGVQVALLANTDRPFATVPGAEQVFRRRRGGPVWRNTFVLPWLARRRPDVFWAPETLTPLWLPVPSVVSVHDLAPVLFPGIKPRRQELAFRTSIRRAVRRATRIVAVSETTARDVARLWGVRREQISVVPNGVDERFVRGDRPSAAAHVRDRWGLDRPYVLFVGTLEPRKGVDLLLSTIALARERALDRSFVLVGRAGYRGTDLVRRATELGARLLDDVPDEELPRLYQAADALLVPSIYEGFGLTPLEAMACGTPAVVAAGAGALEEVSGAAAIVVPERTPEVWLAALDEATHRRGELAERGLGHARQFRWSVVGRRFRAVLDEAAATSTAGGGGAGNGSPHGSSARGRSRVRGRTRRRVGRDHAS
jgi:glycosyltransferase involved in cell wall biosynthesis